MTTFLRWPVLLAISIYVLWLFCLAWPRLHTGPVGIHQWSQTDRQALTLKFAEPGSNPLLPRTYHLVTPDGITSVDPPLIEWLAGMTMRMTGWTHPVIFRAWMLLLHMMAFFFMWRLTRTLGVPTPSRLLLFAGFLFIPLYSYYAVAFLPSAQAFSLFLIGSYFWIHYRFTGRGLRWWILFSILSIWIRLPFILVWTFMWITLIVEKRRPVRWFLTSGLPILLALGAQRLCKAWMTATYGSQFLTGILPADDVWNGLGQWWTSLLFWADQILHPTQWLPVAGLLAYSFVARAGWKDRVTDMIVLLAGLTMIMTHGLILLAQWSAHEYYYLDVTLPILTILVIRSIHDRQPAIPHTLLWSMLLLVLLWLWLDVQLMKEKDQLAATQGADIARASLQDCRECLDKLGISPDDTILTFETYTTNGGLIACGRNGYSSLSTNPRAIQEDLNRPASVVVIPRVFLLTEVYQDYPAIMDWLVRIGGDEDMAVFRKLARPLSGGFPRLLVPEGQPFRQIQLYRSSVEIPEGWAWSPNIDSTALPWQVPGNQEYGPTLQLDPNGARHLAIRAKIGTRNGDHPVSWACNLGRSSQEPDIRYGSIPLTHGDSLAWRAWETTFPADRDNTPVVLYLWNGGGADLLIDSMEVLLW